MKSLEKYESIYANSITVKAHIGTDVYDALTDCIVLAITEKVNVKLEHNKRIFEINPDKFYPAIKGINQLP